MPDFNEIVRAAQRQSDVDKPDTVQCPKCGETSGNDWSQCGGACPMSPHYRADAVGQIDRTTFPRVKAAIERLWSEKP